MTVEQSRKLNIFLEVARELSMGIKITPVLYGSLGLSKEIGWDKQVNDIDVLVPGRFVREDWEDLKHVIESVGFRLVDEKEHAFVRDGENIAFAREEDLQDVSGIRPEELKQMDIDGVRFKGLDAEQYLKVYQMMLRDNYRQEKRGKNDQEKIEAINAYLTKN